MLLKSYHILKVFHLSLLGQTTLKFPNSKRMSVVRKAVKGDRLLDISEVKRFPSPTRITNTSYYLHDYLLFSWKYHQKITDHF